MSSKVKGQPPPKKGGSERLVDFWVCAYPALAIKAAYLNAW